MLKGESRNRVVVGCGGGESKWRSIDLHPKFSYFMLLENGEQRDRCTYGFLIPSREV